MRYVVLLALACCGGKVAPGHSPVRPCNVSQVYDFDRTEMVTRTECVDGTTIEATNDLLQTRH